MTNKERQRSLDKKKWLASEKYGGDLSGNMPFCEHCYQRGGLHGECQAPQQEREGLCHCARAYNRMKRLTK